MSASTLSSYSLWGIQKQFVTSTHCLSTLPTRVPITLGVNFCFIKKKIICYHKKISFIYFACLSVCLSVCLNPINVETAKTDRAQILCWTLHDPKEGSWMIKISKLSLQKNSIVGKFWKFTIFFILSLTFLVLYLKCIQKKMFTID